MVFVIRIFIAAMTAGIGYYLRHEIPVMFVGFLYGFAALIVLYAVWDLVQTFLTEIRGYLRHRPKQDRSLIPFKEFLAQAQTQGWSTRTSSPQTPVLLRAVRTAAEEGLLRIAGRKGDTPIRSSLSGYTVSPIGREHWQEFQIDIRSISPKFHNSRTRTFSMNKDAGDGDSYFDLHVHRADAKRFLKKTKPDFAETE